MTTQTMAIIQSRVGSTRLPGKALATIAGSPLTEHVVRRTHRALPNPVLALPDTPENDRLAEQAEHWPCRVIRGPEEDVLGRFAVGLEQFPEAELIVRVTGDNPLISTSMMKRIPAELENSNSHYATWRHLPFGLGCGVFTRESLLDAHRQAMDPRDREHVTLWIKQNSEYQGKRVTPPESLRAPGFRLTVDTEEDLRLIRTIHDAFPGKGVELSSAEALRWLSNHPEAIRINHSVRQQVYSDPLRVLYTFNQGEQWGHGHRVRFERIRAHRHISDQPVTVYGLRGGFREESPSPAILANSRKPLDQSKIKTWKRRSGADLVILDIKQSSKDLVQSLKEEGAHVIGIEDRGPGRNHMDAVIDPNIYPETLSDDSAPPDRQYYGPDYALIDPGFLDHRREPPPETFNDFGVFLGGTDPNNVGTQFLKEAIRANLAGTFHYFAPDEQLAEMGTFSQTLDSSKIKFNPRGMVDDPAEAFSQMDFMVISGGVVKFEVACLNLPALVVAQNQEQYDNTQRFLEHTGLNWPLFSPDSQAEQWVEYFRQGNFPETARRLARSTEGTVDGGAIERLYTIIDNLSGTF